MNIRIDGTFEKDLRKIKSKPLDKKVALLIRELLAAGLDRSYRAKRLSLLEFCTAKKFIASFHDD